MGTLPAWWDLVLPPTARVPVQPAARTADAVRRRSLGGKFTAQAYEADNAGGNRPQRYKMVTPHDETAPLPVLRPESGVDPEGRDRHEGHERAALSGQAFV